MALKDRFEKVGEDGLQFRGVPFWSWNDKLDPAELARQVNEMAAAGLGGHFMHARKGLITGYMGPDWIRCIRAAVAASKAAGIKAWLYDEDCWPSGSAGGVIPALGEQYVAKRLCWETAPAGGFKPQKRTVATFLIKCSGSKTLEIRESEAKLAARRARPQEQVLHFYYEVPSFNHQPTYTDLLNPKAVKAFIRHTYSAYRKAVGREFAKTIPGIFTDEPQWLRIPWSTRLSAFFKKLKGYDLLPNLPLLVYETGDFRGFRYDFWHAATELFVASFARQVGEWCEKRKIAFTGHFNAEDGLNSQLHSIGAAMPHYEYMQIPGIDHLQRRIGDPLLCKQVSSVAHQFGGRRVLSEMFGCSGWNVNFEELKWIAEWQFVQGIDLVCQHLSLYSCKGCRKRDYPPSLHYQQPWWGDYRLLNDYFARLTFMLTRGKHVADVLLLHNIESAWASFSPEDSKEVDALNRKLVSVSEALLGIHRDFDFGDETLLAKYGRVSGSELRVKSGRYSVVIVPPCVTIRSSTLDLLERFMKHRGSVLVVGSPPKLMDGRPSERPAQVLGRATATKSNGKALKKSLREVVPPRIVVLDGEGRDATDIFVQQRDVNLQQIYFLANTSRTSAVQAAVRLPGSGRLERWDAETGEAEPLKTRRRGKFLEAGLHFEPMGSHLLVLQRRRRPVNVRHRKRVTVKQLTLADSWSLERTEPNALTIDCCSYRIREGEWSDPMPVLTVQDNLRHIAAAEVCEFKYSFTADFAAKLPQYVHLVVEEPDLYEISMNGLPVGNAEAEAEKDLGWWRDISFRRLDVTHLLKPQERNEVVLRRLIAGEAERREAMSLPETAPEDRNRLRYGPEIESIYVIGEFMVRSLSPFEPGERRAVSTEGGFVLTDNWGQVATGDLVAQGLPFYAGSVKWEQTVILREKLLKSAKGVSLSFDPPDAVTAKVHVNGNLASTRGWRPYEAEVGPLLQPGRNRITIELTGSCRNLLGPHHHVAGELYSVGPSSFRGVKSWTDDGSAPDNVWTDRYSFVRFGLAGPVTLTLWK